MAETIGNAGEYNIEELILISASGTETVNLAHAVSEVNIWESIYAPFITGKLALIDDVNYHNILPMVGQEIMKIKLS